MNVIDQHDVWQNNSKAHLLQKQIRSMLAPKIMKIDSSIQFYGRFFFSIRWEKLKNENRSDSWTLAQLRPPDQSPDSAKAWKADCPTARQHANNWLENNKQSIPRLNLAILSGFSCQKWLFQKHYDNVAQNWSCNSYAINWAEH